MGNQAINVHKLSNGMILVAEEIGDVSSGAFVFMVPGGAARDPDGAGGTATVLSELAFRGAGAMDNRTLNERLDGLGLQRHSSISSVHSSFSGALVAENLPETLRIYAAVLREPHLEAEQFQMCRLLALQALESLEDDPRQKIALLVHEQYLPWPYGRPAPGTKTELTGLTVETVRQFQAEHYTPAGTILAAAGKVDFGQLQDTAEEIFGSWRGGELPELPQEPCRQQVFHQPNAGAQVHIGLMYPSVHVTDPDYYKALAAVGVLSGGMGSRLFTEVREKRGLCYAVGAHYYIAGPYGAVQCYVGSSPQQAQEALDVMVAELVKLAEGITEDELDRAKVGLRATLIMSGESTSARAIRCASDIYHLGRVRTLEEIEQAILSLTVEEVVEYVKSHPAKDFTVATIGPKELRI